VAGEFVFAQALAVGTHTIRRELRATASYSASSKSLMQTVSNISTTTTVTPDLNPSYDGQWVAFTVTVPR